MLEVIEAAGSLSEARQAGVVSALAAEDFVNTSFKTDLGIVFVLNLSASLKSEEFVSVVGESGSQATVSRPVVRNLPQGTVLTVMQVSWVDKPTHVPFVEVASSDGVVLASAVLDISMYDAEGNYLPVELAAPLLFRLPGEDEREGVECFYLEVKDGHPHWSGRGVWRASDEEVRAAGQDPGGVWCWTEHLSLFGAISAAILGCTNLELLSLEAVRAVADHQDWHRAGSAVVVFAILSVLMMVWALGMIWETWMLRLGRTYAPKKSLACWKFMVWGPQVLKYRYTAFIVYAKDLLRCMQSFYKDGHFTFKTSAVTASVQRFLAVRSGICTACVAAHLWNGGGWIESNVSLPYTVLCQKLEFHAGKAEDVVAELHDISVKAALRRYLLTVLAIHPLIDAMRVGAGSMTVGKRVLLQVCGTCGTVATNALIFNFSGDLRSWETDARCPISPTSDFFILVATIISIAVNAVPNAFLANFGKQVHRRPLWNLLFWVLVFLYISFALGFVVLVLANLNLADERKWYKSVEWSLLIKMVVMPLAQSLRHAIMLEAFLHEDRRAGPSSRFNVAIGLKHATERQLSFEDRDVVHTWAKQAISAAELVNFMALLGGRVMPKYDAETATCEDVLNEALGELCISPPALQDFPVAVEVVKASGLPRPKAREPNSFSCAVHHLSQTRKDGRFCLVEVDSSGAKATVCHGQRSCHWGFAVSVTGLEVEHAIGFSVKVNGRTLGVACLPVEVLLEDGKWCGELKLLPSKQEFSGGREPFIVPSETNSVPSATLSASRGCSELACVRAKITVKVTLSEGYSEALAVQESRKLSKMSPKHISEVLDYPTSRSKLLARHSSGLRKQESKLTAFCEAKSYADNEDEAPDRMVVHSRKGSFLDLVATVIVDALEQRSTYDLVRELLSERDFHGVLDMLEDQGCSRTSYWIQMFAIDPMTLQEDSCEERWHEHLLASLPTVLRSLRKASCHKNVRDIMGGKPLKKCGPILQLLILDRNCHFMHESNCLSEMMLAQALRVRHKLVLHPDHLKGGILGKEFQLMAKELEAREKATPYLEDPKAVFTTLRDLAMVSVKEHYRDNHEGEMLELDMSSVFASVGLVAANHDTRERDSQAEQEMLERADVGFDAGVD